jgi:hypothetical protein
VVARKARRLVLGDDDPWLPSGNLKADDAANQLLYKKPHEGQRNLERHADSSVVTQPFVAEESQETMH